MAGFHQIFPAESSERFAWCFDVFCPIQEVRRLRKDRALRAGCSRGGGRAKIGTSAFHIANHVHLVTDGQFELFVSFHYVYTVSLMFILLPMSPNPLFSAC